LFWKKNHWALASNILLFLHPLLFPFFCDDQDQGCTKLGEVFETKLEIRNSKTSKFREFRNLKRNFVQLWSGQNYTHGITLTAEWGQNIWHWHVAIGSFLF
jgi:hypothetical protein